MENDVDKQNTDGKKSKKEPWYISLGVLIIIIGAAKYVWFPTLFHFRFLIMYAAALLVILYISGVIEGKISSDPDSCYTCYLGGFIVVITLLVLSTWGF